MKSSDTREKMCENQGIVKLELLNVNECTCNMKCNSCIMLVQVDSEKKPHFFVTL